MASTGKVGYRIDGLGFQEIKGLREINQAMKGLSDDTKKKLKDTHRRAAEIVIAGAKRYVPVQSGALAASIRNGSTQRQGRVRIGSASVPYAGPIHFGWPSRRIKPQPFIYEALDERRAAVAMAYAERIDQLTIKRF